MNKEQIERCLTAYGEDIYRFCCFLTRSRDLADDLYQESFLKAMEVERSVDESMMKNFVIGIAANIWKNTWRKEKRRRKVVSTTEFDAEYMYEPAFGDMEQNGNPQDTYIREETRQIVIRAVGYIARPIQDHFTDVLQCGYDDTGDCRSVRNEQRNGYKQVNESER